MRFGWMGLWALMALTAGAQEAKVGQVGVFTLHKISEKGKFDRCALTLEPGPSMLRIAWTKDRVYSISVPAPPKSSGPLTMRIALGKGATGNFKANANATRAWAAVDGESIGKFMELKKQITIEVGGGRFNWQIGATNLEDAFVKLEDCVNKAVGWR